MCLHNTKAWAPAFAYQQPSDVVGFLLYITISVAFFVEMLDALTVLGQNLFVNRALHSAHSVL